MEEAEKDGRIGGLKFDIEDSTGQKSTAVLAQDCIFIGRLLTAHLPVDDPRISRMHAVIEVRDGEEVILTDLESSNGSRVNGQLEHSINIKSGDVLEFGDSRIVVTILTGDEIAEMPLVIHQSGISRGLSKQTRVDTVLLDPMVSGAGAVDVSADDINRIIDEIVPSDAEDIPKAKEPAKKADEPAAKVETEAATAEKEDKTIAAPVSMPKPRAVLRGVGTALEIKIQWGDEILDIRHLDEPVTLTAGKHRRNTYIIPPMEEFPSSLPIISPVGDGKASGFMLGFTDNMEGWVFTGDRLQSLDDLKSSPRIRSATIENSITYFCPLSPSDKGMISIENLAFCFQTVRAFPKYVSPPNKVDRRPILIWLFLFLTMTIGMQFIPESDNPPSVQDQVKSTVEMAEIVYNRERVQGFLEQMVSEQLRVGSVGGKKDGKVQVAPPTKKQTKEAKAGGAEGKKGKSSAKKPSTSPKPAGRNMAKVLNSLQADDITRILGRTGFTGSGGGVGTAGKNNVKSAPRVFANLGNSMKGGAGTPDGGGGGVGLGGGQSVDVGGIGTKGRGSGSGGYGSVRLGQKLEVAVDFSEGEDTILRGALDKSLVRRVIDRNMGQIKMCYDSKIQFAKGKKTKLNGRVVIAWRIAPNGRVQRARVSESTLNDVRFERCLTDRISSWIFPEPKNGGSVRVQFPFVFRPIG